MKVENHNENYKTYSISIYIMQDERCCFITAVILHRQKLSRVSNKIASAAAAAAEKGSIGKLATQGIGRGEGMRGRGSDHQQIFT